MPSTARTGTPYPAYSDVPDVPTDLQAIILNLEPYTNLRYASAAARDADLTAPLQGMQCSVAGVPYVYNGTAWQMVVTEAAVPSAITVFDPVFPAGFGAYGTGFSKTGWYYQIGKIVHWAWRIEFGATGTPAFNAEVQWNLPVPMFVQGIGITNPVGTWIYRSNVSGLRHYSGSVGLFSVGAMTAFLGGAWDGTAPRVRLGLTGSPALANSDILSASGSYLAA